MIKLALALLLLLFPVSPCHAWLGRVIAVTDGDTIIVEKSAGGEQIKIRLHGIDAPERKQPAGEIARGLLFDVALYCEVEVEEKAVDRYGRLVAIIWLGSGKSLQETLLESGLAWVWPHYCLDCRAWENLQKTARQNQRGLWANPDAIPPWKWRRGARPY